MKLSKSAREATNWLFRAQDATKEGGISKFYLLKNGWCKESYKEVSGYIIPTFFDLYQKTGEEEFKKRALRIADWETKVQEKDGKWEYVFDTGQIVLGLCRAYKETKDQKYFDAVVRASDWLIRIQSTDGVWRREIFANGFQKKLHRAFGKLQHSYNTRTAWALLEVWKLSKNRKYKDAAIKNIEAVLKLQLKNGYYLESTEIPHFLAYTVRGIFEAGLILNERKYVESVELFAQGMLESIEKLGFAPGLISRSWEALEADYSCLTANSQLAIIFFKLYHSSNDKKYLKFARRLVNYTKKTQDNSSKDLGIRGGIAGSSPIEGNYEPNKILSWATKFYIDALILSRQISISKN